MEERVRGSLEDTFLHCWKPSQQHSGHRAQQLGLQQDVVPVWFCNHGQKGNRSSSDCFQGETAEAAGSPFFWHQDPILVLQALGATLHYTVLPGLFP